MSTTIKVRNEDKNKLDRLRSQLQLKGKKIKQEDLLSRIINLAEMYPNLIDDIEFVPFTEEEIHELMNLKFDLGVSTKSIDEEIYGE